MQGTRGLPGVSSGNVTLPRLTRFELRRKFCSTSLRRGFMKRGNRPRVRFITTRNQVKGVIRDDATKLLLGEIVPVNPIPSRGVPEDLSFEQSVTFGPVWEDEERAFTGGEIEFVCQGVLMASSQRCPIEAQSLQSKPACGNMAHPSDGSTVLSVVTDDVEMTLPGFSAWG